MLARSETIERDVVAPRPLTERHPVRAAVAGQAAVSLACLADLLASQTRKKRRGRRHGSGSESVFWAVARPLGWEQPDAVLVLLEVAPPWAAAAAPKSAERMQPS